MFSASCSNFVAAFTCRGMVQGLLERARPCNIKSATEWDRLTGSVYRSDLCVDTLATKNNTGMHSQYCHISSMSALVFSLSLQYQAHRAMVTSKGIF